MSKAKRKSERESKRWEWIGSTDLFRTEELLQFDQRDRKIDRERLVTDRK